MFRLAIAAVLLATSATGTLAQETCRVADPSGRPLNLRDGPNGRVTGTLPNGLAVRILYGDPTWARIGDDASGRPLGWVFRRYLACTAAQAPSPSGRCRVADPSGTALNVRETPDGRITGTLQNGRRVDIVSDGADDPDATWPRIKDGATGQPIGWVFRRYLDCR